MIKEIKYAQHFISVAAITMVISIGSFPIGFSNSSFEKSKSFNMELINGELISIKNANAWINSPSLTAAALKGKVVLIQFGTYTCINWLRTLPYIRAWDEKYKEKGLVVIGIHTPEFAFEKSIDNVSRAMKDMKIDFPIAIDNNQDIWNAFNNHYWPALYLIDSKGRIQYHHFGEGEYEQSEKIIQELLIKAGAKNIDRDYVSVSGIGAELEADWNNLRSAENYLGYERTENFAGPGLKYDKQQDYTAPFNLRLNQWALSGDWTVQKQSIILNKANGKIVYRFHSRDLHLVMGPAVAGTSVRFRVLINSKSPGDSHGIDIDEQGNGTVNEQRMYQLIRQPKPISDCVFEIEFFDAGLEAFAFTFG